MVNSSCYNILYKRDNAKALSFLFLQCTIEVCELII